MPAASRVARWVRCAALVCMPCLGCGGEVALNGLAPVDAGPPDDTKSDAQVPETPVLDATTDVSSEADDVDAAQGTQCSPANCPGCCDSAGSCQLGDDDGKCGSGGRACVACGDPSPACSDGICLPLMPLAHCGPVTCGGGCCDTNGDCLLGQSTPACGTGGNACVDCESRGEVCTMGSCEPDFDGGPCVAASCPSCTPTPYEAACCKADQTCGCQVMFPLPTDGGTCN
jgi:hypothetical protein